MSLQKTQAINLRYFFYIEGVRVLLSSLSVSNRANEVVTLSVDIAPFPEGVALGRGMKVMLFKKEDNELPKLRFSGLLISKSYSKEGSFRSLRLECASINYRLHTMLLCEMEERNLTASPGMTLQIAEENIKTAKSRYEEAKKRLAEFDQVNDRKTLSDEKSKERKELVERVAETSIAAERAVSNKASAAGASSLLETSKLGLITGASVTLSDPTLPSELNVDSSMDGIIGSDAGLVTHINSNPIFANYRGATPATKKNLKFDRTLEGRFESFCKDPANGGDYIKGIVSIIKYAYEQANPYTRNKEYNDLKLSEAFTTMPIVDTDKFNIGALDITKKKGSKNLYRALFNIIRNITQSNKSSIPIKGVVDSMLATLFYQMSVDPLQLAGSIYLHPISLSYLPPKCNVIFPNMYDTLSVHGNSWNEPTRTITIFGDRYRVTSELDNASSLEGISSSASAVLSNSRDPFLSRVNKIFSSTTVSVGEASSAAGLRSAQDRVYRSIGTAIDILSDEEAEGGVVTNTVVMPSEEFRYLDSSDMTEVADFMHSLSKFSMRACEVRGSLIDDIAIGMPIVVLDDLYSIHGVAESVSYSVDTNGSLMSSIRIAYPKMFFLGDDIPAAPIWIGPDKVSPSEIGKAYQTMFGCEAMYNPTIKINKETDSNSFIVANMAASLINQYNRESDKLAFTKAYRARRELTIYEAFGYYGCVAEKVSEKPVDADAISRWRGGIFSAYAGIGDAPATGNSEALKHALIDKQAKVINYTRKAYEGTSGLVSGIVDNDSVLGGYNTITVKRG